ncbi:hypothetical protein MYAER_4212 [Microcystis aeruginosa NIES-2549]|uniref:Uncharacterized protein n=1 Tax=Microcystis aeruginosa NIES-2549 TaxID=1641812 RepID=A0A0F6U8H0_MICAE|nr:hypothetical protein MYAER_4212 [Microcystis aeruginosa NIES-2549]AOC54938.1 hypothetical protein amyaer_4257 [Microcystis aeruginosa NIES-2481]
MIKLSNLNNVSPAISGNIHPPNSLYQPQFEVSNNYHGIT